ncbi:pirin family protein [Streptomyces sp. NPDC021093]|uniref:pirin family protein n=1 Tax=Streptomyces sp. NPDC021093 TaxID=3365112 RepID=UPI003798089B
MISVRRSTDRFRGGDPAAGVESLHAFSFGHFYDPDNLRFGPVLACNEERLAPGAGFDEHPHSHTEIVTWVVEGELTHLDSAGHATVVRPGDVQHLSAGDGVRHVERNAGDVPLVFVQMWLAPLVPGGEPSYGLVREVAAGIPYEVPAAGAALHVLRPGPGERMPLPETAYLHVVRGQVACGGEELGPGDSVRVSGGPDPGITAATAAEVLVWELAAGQ